MAIWFQGCDIGCFGCCNPEIQTFKVANIMTFDQIINLILETKEKHDIEGVTFCGGEPSLQQNLYLLGNRLRELNIGTIMFSGKHIEQLPRVLVESMDMILDGPFILSKLEKERRLLGSTNQRIINITNRYINQMNWFYDKKEMIQEVNLSEAMYFNGDAIVDNEKHTQ
jgi:anaerobic ribonucleoside-triphosphate reductase activating protein